MKIVTDASVLIALATIEGLSLMLQMFAAVFIADVVYDDAVLRDAGVPWAEELAKGKGLSGVITTWQRIKAL